MLLVASSVQTRVLFWFRLDLHSKIDCGSAFLSTEPKVLPCMLTGNEASHNSSRYLATYTTMIALASGTSWTLCRSCGALQAGAFLIYNHPPVLLVRKPAIFLKPMKLIKEYFPLLRDL